jgi:hypothetical protein
VPTLIAVLLWAPSALAAGDPPTNTERPTISGSARYGQTLTGTQGVWTGTAPITYADQWRRCDVDGNNCADIASATGLTYTLSAGDIGARVYLRVTASNAYGTASIRSWLSGTVVSAPINTVLPSLSGNARRGETLTVATGTWVGTPQITYAYQWRRCDVDGNNCTDIAGAAGSTYLLASADVGNRVHARVTATNGYGSALKRTWNSSGIVGAPENTSPPTISGGAQVGQTLSATSGSWSGTQPITYTYRWRRCDSAGASCADVAGATGASYVLSSADVGATVRAQVVATNSAGSASASSAASAVVQGPPPPGGGGGARFGISGMTSTLGSESTADFNRDMSTIDSSGAGWLRIDINWAVIQRNGPTSYDWAPFDRIVVDARARGLSVLGIIDYTPPWARPPASSGNTPPKNVSDYANFASTAVTRYSAMGVHAYEIWNEPNLRVNWEPAANSTRYTELLKAAYTAIHQADPSATVVSGGLSPATDGGTDIDPRTFVQGMYANGAKGYFDALGHHPYCYPAAPGDAQGWSAWYQMYGTPTSLRSTMIANGDGDKKIWATEFGVPTNGPSGSFVSEATQAQQITQAYQLFTSYSWAGPLFVWSSRDNGTDTSTNYNFFGLLRNDFSVKPAFAAYQSAAATG